MMLEDENSPRRPSRPPFDKDKTEFIGFVSESGRLMFLDMAADHRHTVEVRITPTTGYGAPESQYRVEVVSRFPDKIAWFKYMYQQHLRTILACNKALKDPLEVPSDEIARRPEEFCRQVGPRPSPEPTPSLVEAPESLPQKDWF